MSTHRLVCNIHSIIYNSDEVIGTVKMPIGWWRDKQNVAYLTELNNETLIQLLTHIITWMNLKKYILHERSLVQNITCVIPFAWNVQKRQICRKKVGLVTGLGSERDFTSDVHKEFWRCDGNVLKLNWGDGCTTL